MFFLCVLRLCFKLYLFLYLVDFFDMRGFVLFVWGRFVIVLLLVFVYFNLVVVFLVFRYFEFEVWIWVDLDVNIVRREFGSCFLFGMFIFGFSDGKFFVIIVRWNIFVFL